MEKYRSISSVIERTKRQMLKDRNFKKRADRVPNMVNKSQEQTPKPSIFRLSYEE